jgi:hypothetical protein
MNVTWGIDILRNTMGYDIMHEDVKSYIEIGINFYQH